MFPIDESIVLYPVSIVFKSSAADLGLKNPSGKSPAAILNLDNNLFGFVDAAGLYFKGTVTDANVKESCLCIAGNSCLNTPDDMTNYGGLLVTWYFGHSAYALQILLEREFGTHLWIRGKSDWWRAWCKLI